jgi:TRAP-type C4-dicarboxylate transport system permease small subunit
MATPPVRDDALDRLLGLASAVPLALIVVLTFVDVFARYVFSRPVQGASEIIQFAMALTVFVALPLVTRHGEHVTVGLLEQRLRRAFGASVGWLCDGVSAAALLLIAWRLWIQAAEYTASRTATIVLGLPMAPLTYAMAVFAALSAAAVVLRIVARRGAHRAKERA